MFGTLGPDRWAPQSHGRQNLTRCLGSITRVRGDLAVAQSEEHRRNGGTEKLVDLTRSKERVANHGEVFTPPDLVQAMLALVGQESERIDSRFLEPACGSGNFLVPVLQSKLSTVLARYGKSEFEVTHQGLLALMSIYGIELLADNVAECRLNLLEVFVDALGVDSDMAWTAAASRVLDINIIHGNALTMKTVETDPQPITFAEWSYIGRGKYRRRDFRLDSLTQMAAFGEEGTLFADLGRHEIFTPIADHGLLSADDLAQWGAADE